AVEAHGGIDIARDELHAQRVRRVPAELRVQRRVLGAVPVPKNRIGGLRVEALRFEIGDGDEVVAFVAAAEKARVELARVEAPVLDAEACPERSGTGAR